MRKSWCSPSPAGDAETEEDEEEQDEAADHGQGDDQAVVQAATVRV